MLSSLYLLAISAAVCPNRYPRPAKLALTSRVQTLVAGASGPDGPGKIDLGSAENYIILGQRGISCAPTCNIGETGFE